MNINNLFSALKQNTQAPHKQLEATYPFNQQMKADVFTLAHYAQSLNVLRAFHHFAAREILQLPQSVINLIQPESVMAALESDINSTDTLAIEPLTFVHGLPQGTVETRVALSYVWVGSSMGGRIISRWLTSHRPTFPQRYYQTMAEVGVQWEAYKSEMTNYAQLQQIDVDKTVHAASLVFEGLISTAQGVDKVGINATT